MTTLKTTVRDRRVELDVPADWPDGTEVIVQPANTNDRFGIREDDRPDTPEAIAEWLKWCNALEPLKITRAEQADTDDWLKKINDYSIVNRDRGVEDLFQ